MKSPHCLTVLLTLIALAIAPFARAEELKSPDAVLQFALAKNEEYQSFSADFTQSVGTHGTAMTTTFDGSMQFKKPALVRVTMARPIQGREQRMLMVMGADKIMWQEISMSGQTTIMKMDFKTLTTNNPAAAALKNPLDTIDPKKQLTEAMDRYNFTLLPVVVTKEESFYVLQGVLKPDAKLSPRESASIGGYGPQKLYIGQQTGFLERMEQLDKSGSNTLISVAFTNLKFNPLLADDLFFFKPPANANVIDMTQVLMQKQGARYMTNTLHDTYTIMPPSGTASNPATIVSPDGK